MFVKGQADAFLDLSTEKSPATFFSPKGDYIQGAHDVNAAYSAGAQMFESGTTNFEIMQSGSSGDIGYRTGIQRARVRLKEKTDETPMDLRVTEIFRKEDGKWKLIHRQADALKE